MTFRRLNSILDDVLSQLEIDMRAAALAAANEIGASRAGVHDRQPAPSEAAEGDAVVLRRAGQEEVSRRATTNEAGTGGSTLSPLPVGVVVKTVKELTVAASHRALSGAKSGKLVSSINGRPGRVARSPHRGSGRPLLLVIEGGKDRHSTRSLTGAGTC